MRKIKKAAIPFSERSILAPLLAIKLASTTEYRSAEEIARDAAFIARYIFAIADEPSKRKRQGYLNVLKAVADNWQAELISGPRRVGMYFPNKNVSFIYPI